MRVGRLKGDTMTVATICTRLAQTASSKDTVRAAARRMSEQEVGTLVVTDGDGRPEGIVTDRDIVIRCVAEQLDPDKTRVFDVMTGDVVTIHEDASIEGALEIMADRQVRRLVVVNNAGRVSGIVSLDDLLEGVASAAEDIGRLLRRQVHV